MIGRLITKEDVQDIPDDPPRFDCHSEREFVYDYTKVCVYKCPDGTRREIGRGMTEECVDVKTFDK